MLTSIASERELMDEKQELLAIYKLHAELADSVSRQRATANRFYMLVLSGLVVLFSALIQRQNGIPLGILMVGFGLFGMLLAAAWYVVIRSYRQLNSGKFKALHELEAKLAYPFFTREWDLLREGEERTTYWKLTVVETFVPAIFLICFAVLFTVGFYFFKGIVTAIIVALGVAIALPIGNYRLGGNIATALKVVVPFLLFLLGIYLLVANGAAGAQ